MVSLSKQPVCFHAFLCIALRSCEKLEEEGLRFVGLNQMPILIWTSSTVFIKKQTHLAVGELLEKVILFFPCPNPCINPFVF